MKFTTSLAIIGLATAAIAVPLVPSSEIGPRMSLEYSLS